MTHQGAAAICRRRCARSAVRLEEELARVAQRFAGLVNSGRISRRFEELAARRISGFIAYITAGDPSSEATLQIAQALESAGVDILELGIPFSDPLADGPTIQAASNRALAAGMTVARSLELVRRFRTDSELPVVLFTYLNPIYAYGFERFLDEAAAAGADASRGNVAAGPSQRRNPRSSG